LLFNDMNKFQKIISFLSIVTFATFCLLLLKELLFSGLSISEIDVLPIFLGIVLLIDFIISLQILKERISHNIIILIIQILIIIFCLYLIYYFNYEAVIID